MIEMQQGKRHGIYAFAPYGGWNNQQITKNCGLLPYLFYKLWGWHAVMVGGRISAEYPAIADVPGLDFDLLDAPDMEHQLAYFEAHIDDMDVLVLHGAFPFYFPIVERYRALRSDGKIYLETDANSYFEDRIPLTKEFVAFLRQCDVVGVSGRKVQRWLSAKWPCRIDYLPNGFYDFKGCYEVPDFSAKEDIILTVGRLGTSQKRTEDLLEAFARMAADAPHWQLRLVGSREPQFCAYLERYFQQHPELKSRIVFTGPIREKATLLAEYRRAKIFALTSDLEGGTPNVAAEAFFGGCYIITSAIDAAEDMTAGGRCGEIYPIGDIGALASCLRDVCRDEARILSGGKAALQYGRSTYDFTKIVRRLRYLLFGEESA